MLRNEVNNELTSSSLFLSLEFASILIFLLLQSTREHGKPRDGPEFACLICRGHYTCMSLRVRLSVSPALSPIRMSERVCGMRRSLGPIVRPSSLLSSFHIVSRGEEILWIESRRESWILSFPFLTSRVLLPNFILLPSDVQLSFVDDSIIIFNFHIALDPTMKMF